MTITSFSVSGLLDSGPGAINGLLINSLLPKGLFFLSGTGY